MNRRSIVLKSISCRGIKSFNLFQKPSTYAIISISPANKNQKQQKHQKHQKQKTHTDHEGGENPEWDQTIQFDLDDTDFPNLFLEFEIAGQANLLRFGHKLIGKSRVPIADLDHSSGVLRHVSYQLRSSDGKPNGFLSFSYHLNLPPIPIPSAPTMDSYASPPEHRPNSIYPPPPLYKEAAEDCFCYYPAFDRAVSSPVWNGGYYAPAAAAAAALPPVMPAFGAYYPSPAPGYIYPPPHGSCGYWNCQ